MNSNTLTDLKQELGALIELRDALAEAKVKLREHVKVPAYKTYMPIRPEECKWGDAQLTFHQSRAKIKIAAGGERSAKTFTCAQEFAQHATGDYLEVCEIPGERRLPTLDGGRRPYTWIIYSQTLATHLKGPWKKIKELLPADLFPDVLPGDKSLMDAPIVLKNGFTIWLMSYSQEEEVNTGWAVNGLWYDEPPPSKEFFLKGVRGSLDKTGVVWISATPLDCEWMEEFLISRSTKDPRERYVPFVANLDVRDNKYLPKEEVDSWVELLKGTDSEEMHLSGKTKGQLLAFYKDEDVDGRLVDELPEGYDLSEARFMMAINPHDGRPNHKIWWAIWPKEASGLHPIVQIAEEWAAERTFEEDVLVIKDLEARWKMEDVIRTGDPNFLGKKYGNTKKTCAEEYRIAGDKHKIDMTFRNVDDSLAVGHSRVKNLLRNKLSNGVYQFLILKKECPGTPRALKRYRQKDFRNAKPVDNEAKDVADDIRYLVMCRPPQRFGNKTTEEEGRYGVPTRRRDIVKMRTFLTNRKKGTTLYSGRFS